MVYTKTTWGTGTPRSTANLNNMETQYEEAESYADPKMESAKVYAEDVRKSDSLRIRVQYRGTSLPSITPAGRLVFVAGDKQFYGTDGTRWLPIVPKLTLFDGSDGNLFFPKADWIAHETTGAANFATDAGDYLHFGLEASGGTREGYFQFAKGFRSVYRAIWVDWELLHNINLSGTTPWVILPGINIARSAHARQQEYIPVDSEATFSDHGVGLRGSNANDVEIKIWKLIVFL